MIMYANSLRTMASTMAFHLHDHKRPELRYAQTGRGIRPKCSPCCCPWGLDVQCRVNFFFTIFFRREIRSSIFVSRPAIFRFALAEYTHSSLCVHLLSGGLLLPEAYCLRLTSILCRSICFIQSYIPASYPCDEALNSA